MRAQCASRLLTPEVRLKMQPAVRHVSGVVRVRTMPRLLMWVERCGLRLVVPPILTAAREQCAPQLPILGVRLRMQLAVLRLSGVIRRQEKLPLQTRAVQSETHRAGLLCSTTGRLQVRLSLPMRLARLKARLLDSQTSLVFRLQTTPPLQTTALLFAAQPAESRNSTTTRPQL